MIPATSGADAYGIDLHFARFICKRAKSDDPLLHLAAQTVSNAMRKGHVCADLELLRQFPFLLTDAPPGPGVFPDPSEWIEILKKTSVVGSPGDFRPLIIDNKRLYLHRYWRYEQTLAASVLDRAKAVLSPHDPAKLGSMIGRLFPSASPEEPGGQKTAALVACLKNFLILSGGPGTGKTTTVAKILLLLLEYAPNALIRIALASPTGKAAARLKQAMDRALSTIDISEATKTRLPREAFTIHRLLGAAAHSQDFTYNARNPLPFDIVVIDEASMADQALMTRLLSAIPLHAKVILVGDKDQLASVDAGAVLGDLCYSGGKHSVTPSFSKIVSSVFPDKALANDQEGPFLSDSIVELKTNYRFTENSGIGILSRLVKEGEAEESWNLLLNHDCNDITRHNVPSVETLAASLSSIILQNYSPYFKENEPLCALERFDTFRVLCAVRNGPYGVTAINEIIGRILEKAGLIRPSFPWYRGRPVMVIANDYDLELFNGDIGVALPDPARGGAVSVFFPAAKGTVRSFAPGRLPPHETVYAMTIHKAQGSEFDRVLLVVPPVYSPVLSRELLYTGITRAHSACALWCTREVFLSSVKNRTVRMSGLREKLWGAGLTP